mmetsp:Transcript_6700/g.9256  ORF Transcript_6700/g.9256 Transcript_6700/m.9256 type:complete len:368 (-) Transcript_6700:345-1448(-)|eukprot:CAMPEP_0184505138 /NCGR_PEP_ID=MMETSP0113_2-20130426/52828_1 /TAXON_ID=91329 /ORGANISM="Norrisiella sphaerica, Strain BC52" /LENGTH=367 /DNA_ID=CAMNT_0026894811 /DNA_START=322 /DNA_END=1425 /DNA_ORIENTATION=-
MTTSIAKEFRDGVAKTVGESAAKNASISSSKRRHANGSSNNKPQRESKDKGVDSNKRESSATSAKPSKRNGKENGHSHSKHQKSSRSAAAFIKAKVQSALKKRAKEKVTISSFIAQNNHIFFTAGFCILAVLVAALLKVKDVSPGALRKEISAYKSQNSVLKNEVNLVHQENAALYNRILTLHNHLMQASSQYTRWHTALNEDLIRPGEEQIRPYTAVVPEGVTPGSGFEVVVDGQIYLVACPKGCKPGDTVAFDLLAQVLSQVVDGGLVNAPPTPSFGPSRDLRKSWEVVSGHTNVTRLTQQLSSPRIHWIRMREEELPKVVNLPPPGSQSVQAEGEASGTATNTDANAEGGTMEGRGDTQQGKNS